jgi:HSP20 family molecular chaperone IbpA
VLVFASNITIVIHAEHRKIMSLFEWQPLQILETLCQHLQDILTDLSTTCPTSTVWVGSNDATWISDITILETTRNVILSLQLPNVELNDLDIQVSPETAVIQNRSAQNVVEGYFDPGPRQHLIPLPIAVHPEAVQAEFKHGNLVLILPKAGRTKRQRINVQVQDKSHDLDSAGISSAELYR